MTLDPIRQRLIVAAGRELMALDAFTERPLYRHLLPAPASALAVAPQSGVVYVTTAWQGGEESVLYTVGIDGILYSQVGGLGHVSTLAAGENRLYLGDVRGQR
ncbi:MAG: hypothetical protein H5T70_13395, partial [Chloroflexi bacterium]|nr:hypothetical protein [Chloroflexota bacterium]